MVDLVARLRAHPLIAEPWGDFGPIEVLDWRANERGTPSFAGVLNHHTVSRATSGRYPSKGICQHGRGGSHPVPGPLCNILGARGGGSVAVISNRVANHAGTGDPDVIRRLRARQHPKPRPGPDRRGAGGGPATIGIEWENDGTGEPWVARMVNTMVRVNAALCDIFGWDPLVACIGHLEFTTRKIDPAFHEPRMTMADFRRLVSDCLAAWRGGAHPTPNPQEWDEMATKEEIQELTLEAAALVVMAITGDQFDPAKLRDTDVTTLKDISAEIRLGVLAAGVQIIQQVGAGQGVTVDAEKVAKELADELARRLGD